MVLVLFMMAWTQSIGSASAAQRSPAQEGFTAYNGSTYQVPSSAFPCNWAVFNDHGVSVRLCVDNYGMPLPPLSLPPSDSTVAR